jgi:nicotinamidase-related amidase
MSTTEKNATVLLVMDIQKTMMTFLPDPEPLLAKIDTAIDTARSVGIEVIYVVLSFRKGHPEIHPRHKTFSQIKEAGSLFTEGHEGTALHAAVAPREGEMVVHKKRVSAFAGSDLDMLLRSKNVHHLLLTGFATSGIVLSTVREGADKDYQITVLSDACADPDTEVHDFLVRKIFPASGDVMTTGEWVDLVKS